MPNINQDAVDKARERAETEASKVLATLQPFRPSSEAIEAAERELHDVEHEHETLHDRIAKAIEDGDVDTLVRLEAMKPMRPQRLRSAQIKLHKARAENADAQADALQEAALAVHARVEELEDELATAIEVAKVTREAWNTAYWRARGAAEQARITRAESRGKVQSLTPPKRQPEPPYAGQEVFTLRLRGNEIVGARRGADPAP